MDGFKIFTLIVTIVFLILLILVFLFIRKPELLKQHLIKTYDIIPDINVTDSVLNVEKFENYTIYELVADPPSINDIIVIDIPGGAFIESVVNFKPYQAMKLPYNVISITYPTLFDNRAKDAISYIERAIKHIQKTKYPQAQIVLIGTSAGAYYATKVINRSNVKNISKFIGICGYYGAATMPYNVVVNALDRMYLTSFKDFAEYQCNVISSNILSLYITSTDDFLEQSTKSYAMLCQQKVYTFGGNHTFFTQDTPSAQEAYDIVKSFITGKPIPSPPIPAIPTLPPPPSSSK